MNHHLSFPTLALYSQSVSDVAQQQFIKCLKGTDLPQLGLLQKSKQIKCSWRNISLFLCLAPTLSIRIKLEGILQLSKAWLLCHADDLRMSHFIMEYLHPILQSACASVIMFSEVQQSKLSVIACAHSGTDFIPEEKTNFAVTIGT